MKPLKHKCIWGRLASESVQVKENDVWNSQEIEPEDLSTIEHILDKMDIDNQFASAMTEVFSVQLTMKITNIGLRNGC